jgi:hypothetical protein
LGRSGKSRTWKIEKIFEPAVSEPEGELPSQPPHMCVAKIEVSDLDAMSVFLELMKVKTFSNHGAFILILRQVSPLAMKFNYCMLQKWQGQTKPCSFIIQTLNISNLSKVFKVMKML